MFTVRLAGLPFEIDNRFGEVEKLTQDYAETHLSPIARVSATSAEIRERSEKTNGFLNLPMAEAYVLFDKICALLPKKNALMLHASAVVFDGKAYLFAGARGVGKTTHIRLWQKHFGNRVNVLCGDKPIIRLVAGEFFAYGTPFGGKEGMQKNDVAPLGGICFLSQSTVNSIRPMMPEEFVRSFLMQTVLPSSADALGREAACDLLGALYAKVPIYALACNMTDDAVLTAFKALKDSKA